MSNFIQLLKALILFKKWKKYVSKLAPPALHDYPNYFIKACQEFNIISLQTTYAQTYVISIDPSGGSITEDILKTGTYQSQIMNTIPTTFQPNCTLFVNVGANIGTTCLNATIKGFKEILAFEPVKKNHDLLTRNLLTNHINATVYQFGLGAKDAKMQINLHPTSGGRHSIKKPFHEGLVEEIEIKRLDSLCITRDFFLWIDAEGYEYEIIVGGLESIKKHCVGACIEISPSISGIDDSIMTVHLLRTIFNRFIDKNNNEIDMDEFLDNIHCNSIQQIDLICLKHTKLCPDLITHLTPPYQKHGAM